MNTLNTDKLKPSKVEALTKLCMLTRKRLVWSNALPNILLLYLRAAVAARRREPFVLGRLSVSLMDVSCPCSELTGLTIPGLSGTLSDCIKAMNLTAYLPHIGSRVWAIIRREHIYYSEKGRLDVKDLRGADKMDPGNYKGGVGALRAFIAGWAAEFGVEKVRVDALEELDTDNKGLSATSQVVAPMARLMPHQDLANATLHGPEPAAMQGPLLADCKFPEVLVAKAYSHGLQGLGPCLIQQQASRYFYSWLRAIDSWRCILFEHWKEYYRRQERKGIGGRQDGWQE
ncbi:hypothetical protein LTR92_001287 [Exophiala xenobiotica]|nr:hypothetical protein LTR92_001287 [Exophiala xenobiotica]